MLLVQHPARMAALNMETLEEQFCTYPPLGMGKAVGAQHVPCNLQGPQVVSVLLWPGERLPLLTTDS